MVEVSPNRFGATAMTYEDFAAYWAENEDNLRRYVRHYVASRPDCESIVDDVLALARAELEQSDELTRPLVVGAAYRYVSPFIPQMSYETYAVISALKATGNDGYEGSPETVRNFLAEWHLEEMAEPYHPVLRHIDLTAVDWWEVTLAVLA
jgi:hypothetical protein